MKITRLSKEHFTKEEPKTEFTNNDLLDGLRYLIQADRTAYFPFEQIVAYERQEINQYGDISHIPIYPNFANTQVNIGVNQPQVYWGRSDYEAFTYWNRWGRGVVGGSPESDGG